MIEKQANNFKMSFAAAVNSSLNPVIQYRSVKFSTSPNATVADIARALIVTHSVDEIKQISQDPGKGNWTVITTTEKAEQISRDGFDLLEEQIKPTPYLTKLITATMAFVPPRFA